MTLTSPSPTIEPNFLAGLVTTTIFPNGTAAPIVSTHHEAIPIAPIVGGVVGGIILAVAVVVGWIWWGRCIKRDKTRERSNLLAGLEVRENTRRNASSHSQVRDVIYGPAASFRQHKRTIKFASGSSSVSTTPLTGNIEKEATEFSTSADHFVPRLAKLQSLPHKRSPLYRTVASSEPLSPTSPPSSFNLQNQNDGSDRYHQPTHLEPPSQAHRVSAVSTPSLYSTQSGGERHSQHPPSLLMAALGSLDSPKQSPSSYLAPRLGLSSSDEPSRLSQISSGSGNTQPDDHPDIPIGYAQ